MYTKLITIALALFLFSCNDGKENDSKPAGAPTTISADDDEKPSGDVEAQKKALNEQSRACIALMNALEPEQNAAYAAGNADLARSIKERIDSAARENVMIGQKLMALDK